MKFIDDSIEKLKSVTKNFYKLSLTKKVLFIVAVYFIVQVISSVADNEND